MHLCICKKCIYPKRGCYTVILLYNNKSTLRNCAHIRQSSFDEEVIHERDVTRRSNGWLPLGNWSHQIKCPIWSCFLQKRSSNLLKKHDKLLIIPSSINCGFYLPPLIGSWSRYRIMILSSWAESEKIWGRKFGKKLWSNNDDIVTASTFELYNLCKRDILVFCKAQTLL